MSTATPTLNWIPFKDARSREYGVRRIIGPTPRYRRLWAPRPDPLDQGQEGACTGYATAAHLSAAPNKWKTDAAMAEAIFRGAVKADLADGRDFGGQGATVLGAMKAGQRLGYFDSYVWAFGIDDVIDCIVRKSPVVLGISWYPNMSNPDPSGLISIGGGNPAGHCIMANGYWPQHPDFGDVIVLTNSWGSDWGLRGRCYLRVSDAKRLLEDEEGEAVTPHEVRQRATMVPPDGEGADHLLDFK